MTEPACGTYAGYQAHQRRGEPPCDPCRAANADYMRQYRLTHTRYRTTNAARSRALWRLADNHPAEFRRLAFEEYEAADTEETP